MKEQIENLEWLYDEKTIDEKNELLWTFLKLDEVHKVKTLLEHGADANFCLQYFGDKTPLHYAAEHGLLEMVTMLVSSGANIHAQLDTIRFNGETPLALALWERNFDMIELLVNLGANIDDMGDMLKCGSIAVAVSHIKNARTNDMIPFLVRLGADVNVQDTNGVTAIHCAAGHGWHHMVALLIKYKADPNIVDRFGGDSALHVAVLEGNDETVEILLRGNADPTLKCKQHNTPLDLADAFHKDAMGKLFALHI